MSRRAQTYISYFLLKYFALFMFPIICLNGFLLKKTLLMDMDKHLTAMVDG